MNYYEERIADLTQQFNDLKEKTFQKMLAVIAEWSVDSQKLQEKYAELIKRRDKKEEEKKETK
jgi:uncharacterized coiled-coil protein SlyX